MQQNKIILLSLAPTTSRTAEENLSIAYLGAVLKDKNYNVKLIDNWLANYSEQTIIDNIINDKAVKVLGISCYMSTNQLAIEFAGKVKQKRKDIKFICGGYGPSFNMEYFLEENIFDFVSYGEGELTIIELCNYIINNIGNIEGIKGIAYKCNDKVKINDKRELIKDLDSISFPLRDNVELAMKRMSTVGVVTSRGCLGNCSFCSISAMTKLCNGARWRGRSAENIVEELNILHNMGVRYIKFVDDSFIDGDRNIEWVKNLYKLIKDKNINMYFRSAIRADKVDDDMMYYLKKIGFRSFSCGIENGSKEALKRMNKIAQIDTNEKALKILKKHKMYIQAGFILFDNETTFSEVVENYKFLNKHKYIINKGIFSEMYAANGTEFTKRLKDNKQILDSKVYDNNKYNINDIKASIMYKYLKMWHKAHVEIYDKVIDPISSPKALNDEEMEKVYQLYMKIREKDLVFMGNLINLVDSNETNENIEKYFNKIIEENKSHYLEIEDNIDNIYIKNNMIFDSVPSPYLL